MNKQRKQDIKEVMDGIMELQNQMADECAKLVERQARAAHYPWWPDCPGEHEWPHLPYCPDDEEEDSAFSH